MGDGKAAGEAVCLGFSWGCPLPDGIPEAVGQWSRVGVSGVWRASARWGGEVIPEGGAHLQVREVREQGPLGTRVSSCSGKGVRTVPTVQGELGVQCLDAHGKEKRLAALCPGAERAHLAVSPHF